MQHSTHYLEIDPPNVLSRKLSKLLKINGGERGIRTHVRVSPKHAFQACAFNHSAISPGSLEVDRRGPECPRQFSLTFRSDAMALGPRQQFFRPRQRFGLCILTGVGHDAGQRSAGRYVVSLGVPLLAQLVNCEIHLPAVDVDLALAIVFGFHTWLADFATPFSTGAPTRLPHSVQEPDRKSGV